MTTIISILVSVLLICLTFKIVPAVLGFAFSLFLAILQVIGIILLLTSAGIFCFALDIVLIFAIVAMLKVTF